MFYLKYVPNKLVYFEINLHIQIKKYFSNSCNTKKKQQKNKHIHLHMYYVIVSRQPDCILVRRFMLIILHGNNLATCLRFIDI
jgi:hypothetical protein